MRQVKSYTCYHFSGMDMSLMSSFMGMPGMNMGVNPLVQLLNQNGLHPNWPAGLSGIVFCILETVLM